MVLCLFVCLFVEIFISHMIVSANVQDDSEALRLENVYFILEGCINHVCFCSIEKNTEN